jgi:hypothetical protein
MTNGNGKTLVPFMGGSVVIKEGGYFKDAAGKQVDYDPCPLHLCGEKAT